MKVEDISTVDLEGKVVVARLAEKPDFLASVDLARLLKEQGASLVLILGPGDSLEALDEAEMAKSGWVRKV